MREKKEGFTLIELLVVVAIIALLLSVLMPALSRAKELAKRVVCANNLKQVGIAVSGYEGKYSGLVPNAYDVAPVSSPPGGPGDDEESLAGAMPNVYDVDPEGNQGSLEKHPYACYRSDKVWPDTGDMVPYRFACLYEARLMDNPKMFYCPSNRNLERKYESYMNPAPWGTLPQQYNADYGSNQWVRAGYEWFPRERNAELEPFTIGNPARPPAPTKLCMRFEKLDQQLPYCTDVMRLRENFSHKYGRVMGLNVLYPDGHVTFFDDQNVFRDRMWDDNLSGQPGNTIMSIYNQRILTLGAGTPVYDD